VGLGIATGARCRSASAVSNCRLLRPRDLGLRSRRAASRTGSVRRSGSADAGSCARTDAADIAETAKVSRSCSWPDLY